MDTHAASECLRLALGLAQGVGVLHDLGLLHRDIKPSNIILIHGMPKLADLGLVSSSDRTLTSVGTPDYAPPEGPGSIRADLYSLGRVLYELVTGLPSAAFPRIPESLLDETADDRFLELNEVLLKAGAPDPEDRYPSADTMLADLRFIETGGSIKAVSALRRYIVWSAWTASAVVVAVAFAAVMHAARDRFLMRTEREKTATARRTSIYVGDLALTAQALADADLAIAGPALRRLETGSRSDGSVGIEYHLLRNEAKGDEVMVLRQKGAGVRPGGLRFNGGTLAVFDADNRVELRRVETGERLTIVTNVDSLGPVTDSGKDVVTGRRLDTGGIGWVRFPADPRREAMRFRSASQMAGNGGRSGSFITHERMPGGDWQFQVVDSATGTVEGGFATPVLAGRESLVAAASSAPEGPHLAVFSRDDAPDRTSRVYWWVGGNPTGPLLRTSTDESGIPRFSPDGGRFAIRSGEAVLELHSAADQRLTGRVTGHRLRINDAQFSPDGRFVATAADDQTLRISDAGTGEERARFLGHEGPVTAIVWDSDARHLYTGGEDGTVRAFDVDTPPRRTRHEMTISVRRSGDFVFSSDGRQVAASAADGSTTVYDTASRTRLGRCPTISTPIGFSDDGTVIGLAADGSVRRQAIEAESHELQADGTRPLPSIAAVGQLKAVPVTGISRNGRWIVSAGRGQRPRLLDREGRAPEVEFGLFAPDLQAVAISDDGHLCAGLTADGPIEVGDPTGDKLPAKLLPLRQAISIDLAPDGRWLAVGTVSGDVELRRLTAPDAVAAEPIVLSGHSRPVDAVAFSPDGRRLLSVGGDARMIIWTVEPEPARLLVLSLRAPSGAHDLMPSQLRFAPDDGHLGVLTSEGRLRLFDLRR